jgi:VIT1/CCC1 family predicted Fe2+/Mn2+ transporter
MAVIGIHEKASYLRDVVLGVDDGVITTFAIIAGAAGASLSANVVIILGLAKLLADGISMGASVYMSTKSEVEYEKAKNDSHWKTDAPLKESFITFFSFIFAGLTPLIPFLFNLKNSFLISSLILVLILFALGSFKSINTKKSWIIGGIEMLVVGGLAAVVAYIVGFLADKIFA